MDLKKHPLISHKSPKQIYDCAQHNTGFGPFEKVAVDALLKHAGVPAKITQDVFRDVQAPFGQQAEEISRKQAEFLDAATDEDLIGLMLQRVISSSKNVDLDVWIQRVDDAIHTALGVPSGTVLRQVDTEHDLSKLTSGVHAAYLAQKSSTPSPE